MTFLDKLERALGRFAISNLSLYLVIGQVFVLLLSLMHRIDLSLCVFVPELVLRGQWWRLITFWFMPPPPGWFDYLFVAFAWYMFYLMGSALEHYWGEFRYNLFLLLGYVLTVAVSFVTPGSMVTNLFIADSVLLAFAYLNPEFEFLLLFILPLKIKWLALFNWVVLGVLALRGDLPIRLQIFASVGNFLVFFSGDILRSIHHGRRKMVRQAQTFAEEGAPRHRCHVCGKTDRTDPQLDFRYCSKCAGDQCYCPEHIQKHVHVTVADEKPRG